mgnify:CR=1 FL=1
MTEEIKILIDKLPIETIYRKETKELFNCVKKSDVILLIEELTKWNKVEDRLPMSDSVLTVVLVKLQGRNLKCSLGVSTATFDGRTCKFKTRDKFVDVTDWRYI